MILFRLTATALALGVTITGAQAQSVPNKEKCTSPICLLDKDEPPLRPGKPGSSILKGINAPLQAYPDMGKPAGP